MKKPIKRFCSLLLSFLFIFSLLPSGAFAQGDLSDAVITFYESYTYTGEAIIPNITVTLSSATLIEGEDYTVSCCNNINAGTATVIVTGIGAYSGEKEENFNIAKAPRTDAPPMPALFCKTADTFFIDMYYGMEYAVTGWGGIWTDVPGVYEAIPGEYTVAARYKETENFLASYTSETLYFEIEGWPDNPNPTQIPQPRAVRFDGFMLEWEMVKPAGAPEDWDCRYEVELYRDGEFVAGYSRDVIGEHKFELITDGIDQSGSYEFRITAIDLHEDYERSEPLFCYYEYIKPEASISSATNLQWSVENGDVYTSFDDSGNEDKELGFYPYHFQVRDSEYDTYTYGVHCFGTKNRCNTNFNADRSYIFKVRIYSGDIRRWTHSEWSEASPLLYLGDDIEDVGDALRDLAWDLVNGFITAQDALDAIKELDQDELKLAMQTDDELLGIIEDIETAYLAEKGITATTSVSSAIADKLDGEVSVIGAGLNSSGGNVVLNFENKKEDVTIESRYVNYVQLSIEMDGVEDSSDLDVPIRITMPIPKPLSVNRLVIMHYTNVGTYESVAFTVNGDGTISFTVTHLSEFLFAEEETVTPDTSWYVGHESEASYVIDTADELAGLAWLVNNGTGFSGKTINLTGDIDLSGYGDDYNGGEGWISIGDMDLNTFEGNFNGGGHVISGLYIDSSKDYAGLFGRLDGTVSKLGLEEVNITGSGKTGAVATYVAGAVEKCYVSGAVSGFEAVGGISGGMDQYGRINNCYTTCTVIGNRIENYGYSGGIVGVAMSAPEYCYATGAVTSDMGAGGIVGISLYLPRNCVALNERIEGSSSGNTGRVAGEATSGLCNYAYSEIPTDFPGGWYNKAKNTKNGADVTLETVMTSAFWATAANWDVSGWDTDVWDIQNDKLPTLIGFAGDQPGLPDHLTVLDIGDADISISGTYTYTGGLIMPPAENVTVTIGGHTLVNGTDYTYAVTEGGTSAGTATVTVTGTGRCTGSKTATFTIGKAAQSAPSQPALDSKNATSVTLHRDDARLEFRMGTDGEWQANGYFASLTPNTAYTFYARYAERADHFASPVSASLTVTTDKASLGGSVIIEGTLKYGQTLTASTAGLTSDPVIADLGTLAYQWRRGGADINGAVGKTYTLTADDIGKQISVLVTASNCKEQAVSAQTALISKADGPAAPQNFEMTCSYNSGASNFTVTIPYVAGGEYSFDGSAYSGTRTTAASPGASVTGYVRYAETATHKASPAKTAILTLPYPAVSVTVTGTDGADSITTNGGTLQMLAEVLPANAAQAVTWSISGGSGASIGNSGLLTATGNGTVTVRATAKDGTGVYGELSVTITGQTVVNPVIPGNTVGPPADTPEIPGDNTVTTPSGQPPVADEDGNITLPGGGMVETPGGSVIDVPPGTAIDKDGSITIPEGKEAEMTLPGGTEVTLPGGSTIDGGGNTTLGGGVQVDLPDGSTLNLPKGSTINDSGHITVGPGGATLTKGNTTLTIEEGTTLILDDDVPLGHWIQFDNPFADVKDSDWFYGNVGFVYNHGLFKGTSATTFSPNAPMTRAMAATVLARLSGADPDDYGSSRFSDVAPGAWYADSVEWAADMGIVTGVGNGKFDPDASVTREQLAVMIYNFAKARGHTLPGGENEIFADEDTIGTWAKEAVKALQSAGVIGGKPGNVFDPGGEATRAEVAAMLERFVNLVMGG